MSDAAPRPKAALALAGLALALLLPSLGIEAWLVPGADLAPRLAREAIWWTFALLVIIWIVRVERRPLASIGLKAPGWRTLVWGLLATLALIASAMLSYALILPALGFELNRAATASITRLPLWLQLAIFVRAGVVEEILFRGYPIERLIEYTGRRWLGALVPAAFFIAAHYAFWGTGQLIVVAFGTLILTGLYLWRRDLPCCMLAHILADTIGFTLARLQS